MMYICRLCGQRFGQDLVKLWAPVGESNGGKQLYLTSRYGQVHELQKEKDVQPEVPVSDLDLSNIVSDVLGSEPAEEPVE